MTDETTLPPSEASVDAGDIMVDMLMGEETNEVTTDEIVADIIEDSEDDTEASDEEQPDESTAEDESNEEEQDEQDESPETWAEALGVEDTNLLLNEEGQFAGVNVKVDGESSTVGMKDLIAGYQSSKHNTNTSQALAEDRRQFESVRDNAVADYTKKLNDVSKLSEFMHKSLISEYESIDWNALRTQDPAEYAAAYQDFERRKQEIQQIYSAIETERTTEQSTTSTQNQEAQQSYLKGELQKVMANNPEWDTPDKLQGAFKDMGDFVNETYGITPEVFNALGDSRYVEVMKDAMAYRKGKKVTQAKVKQKLPKFQKSKNGAKRKTVSKLDKLTKAAKGSSGANKRQLQDGAIAELLTGGL